MADLDSVINAALDEVESGNGEVPAPEYNVEEVHAEAGIVTEEETPAPGAGEETPPEEETPTPEEEVVPEAEVKPEEKVETGKDKPGKGKPADDAVTKLLKENGIEAGKTGRVNNIPYPRVHKIVTNALAKNDTKWQGEVKKRDDELTPMRAAIKNYQGAEQLAGTDPDKYVAALAQQDPRYKKFVDNATEVEKVLAKANAPAPVIPDEKDDPRPEADQKFTDGTTGYSNEQFQKLNEWNQRAGARQALKAIEARLGPVDKLTKQMTENEKVQQDRTARVTAIRNTTNLLRTHFGDLFSADEKLANEGKSEIIAYQREHHVGLLEAGLAVLIPKLAANRAKIRQELIAESKKRKTVVAPAPANARPVKKVDPNAPIDLDSVINEAIDAAGIDR